MGGKRELHATKTQKYSVASPRVQSTSGTHGLEAISGLWDKMCVERGSCHEDSRTCKGVEIKSRLKREIDPETLLLC